MARIIRFPRQQRGVPPLSSASRKAPKTDLPGEEWFGPLICGVLGVLLIPLMMLGVLLGPVLACLLGLYLIGLLIGLLLGGIKWLLIGLALFVILGALMYVCASGKGK